MSFCALNILYKENEMTWVYHDCYSAVNITEECGD